MSRIYVFYASRLDAQGDTIGHEQRRAARALDFRDLTLRTGVQVAYEVIRKHVACLDDDRPLYPDHNAMPEIVRSGEIWDAVETAVGPLG